VIITQPTNKDVPFKGKRASEYINILEGLGKEKGGSKGMDR
jgi:hypothetical protein